MLQENSKQTLTSEQYLSINQPASKQQVLLYFLIILGVFAIDQICKLIIIAAISESSGEQISVIDGFLRLVHVRNPALVFGIGKGMHVFWKFLLKIFAPLALLIGMSLYLVFGRDFTRLQRILVSIIIGGGLGNFFDRVFRASGVVDFIDVRIYGMFNMEWWPTFNVADMAIVVGGLTFFVFSIFSKPRYYVPDVSNGAQPTDNEKSNEQNS